MLTMAPSRDRKKERNDKVKASGGEISDTIVVTIIYFSTQLRIYMGIYAHFEGSG